MAQFTGIPSLFLRSYVYTTDQSELGENRVSSEGVNVEYVHALILTSLLLNTSFSDWKTSFHADVSAYIFWAVLCIWTSFKIHQKMI